MANQITTAGRLGSGGWVGELSGGGKVAVIQNGSANTIEVWLSIDGTPSMVASATSTTIHGGTTAFTIAAVLDSSDVLHIVSNPGTNAHTRDIAYNTLSNIDGTPSWGTWTEAAATTQPLPATSYRSIWIEQDGSGNNHVWYVDGIKDKGTTYAQIVYIEDSSGWSTPVVVNDAANAHYHLVTGVVDGSGNIHVLFRDSSTAAPYYDVNTGSGWGTDDAGVSNDAFYTVLMTVDGTALKMLVTESSANILFGSDVDTLSDTTFNGWGTLRTPQPTIMQARVQGDLYVFYIDADQDIHLISHNGSSWTDEGELQAGTVVDLVVSNQVRNQNNTTTIDYIWAEGNTVYWDEFSLAGGSTVTFAGTAAGTTTTPDTVALTATLAFSGAALGTTTTPDTVILAVLREFIGTALGTTTTPDTVELMKVISFAGVALGQTTTPDTAVLAVLRSFAGAALGTTTTPDTAVLTAVLSFAGAALGQTTTLDTVILSKLIPFAGAALGQTTTPDTAALLLIKSFAGAAIGQTTTPDTADLVAVIGFTGQVLGQTTTPGIDLAVIRGFTGAALGVTTTPDTVELTIAGLVTFAGSALGTTTTPDTVALAVTRAFSGVALGQTTTPATDLSVLRQFIGAALGQTTTPDTVILSVGGVVAFAGTALGALTTPAIDLAVLRGMIGAALGQTITPDTVALPVLRGFAGQAQGQTTTPDVVTLALLLHFAGVTLGQTTTPDDIVLIVELVEGEMIATFSVAAPGMAFAASPPEMSVSVNRPKIDFST